MARKIEQLSALKEDIQGKNQAAIVGFEGVIATVLKNVFGEKSEFVLHASKIQSGWTVAFENKISYMDENSGAQLSQGKKKMYLELIDNAIHYAELYMSDEPTPIDRTSRQPSIHVDTINAQGGFLNLGKMFDSPVIINNSIHEIERQIEEKGGEDKDDLMNTLNEVKSYIEECQKEDSIIKKPGLGARLNTHVVKHGWFYGAVLQLLGAATLQFIG